MDVYVCECAYTHVCLYMYTCRFSFLFLTLVSSAFFLSAVLFYIIGRRFCCCCCCWCFCCCYRWRCCCHCGCCCFLGSCGSFIGWFFWGRLCCHLSRNRSNLRATFVWMATTSSLLKWNSHCSCPPWPCCWFIARSFHLDTYTLIHVPIHTYAYIHTYKSNKKKAPFSFSSALKVG